jgi:hypothetical protein
MPRCPRKTRRCKFSGNCVTKASKPYTEKQKKRCPKGYQKCADRVCHLRKKLSVKRISSMKSSVKRTPQCSTYRKKKCRLTKGCKLTKGKKKKCVSC